MLFLLNVLYIRWSWDFQNTGNRLWECRKNNLHLGNVLLIERYWTTAQKINADQSKIAQMEVADSGKDKMSSCADIKYEDSMENMWLHSPILKNNLCLKTAERVIEARKSKAATSISTSMI